MSASDDRQGNEENWPRRVAAKIRSYFVVILDLPQTREPLYVNGTGAAPKDQSMKIHEYQAKDILARYGVAIPRGEVANTLEEAVDVARGLFAHGAKGVVVKAQIHAGGRGKGGGVKVAKTLSEAEEYAKQILGMQLITHQTGPQGQKVQRLLVEETADIDRELYLGIVLDRAAAKLVFMASQSGGMEIEEVAAKDPNAIVKAYIDPGVGFEAYQARKLAFALGLKPTQLNDAVKFMSGLYRAFIETDASLLEINPFITTKDDRLLALDCKINFDDNAIFRHKELKELRDIAEEDPLEVEASKYALNYIKLDGNIACMVNGAGLAMATMDIIQYAGGSPANFLDVGGGASQQQIEHAFEILLSDRNVQAVFINIFGGILRVDTLAHGVVEAAKKTNVKVPVVLRLEGTNVEQGREILKNSGLNFIIGETMQDAAQKVVSAAETAVSFQPLAFSRLRLPPLAQAFQDLVVWQRAIELSVCIYELTRTFPKDELYGLTSQLRRASVSVASNIAEGRGRLTEGEFSQFLGLAQGSNYEVQTQLVIARHLHFSKPEIIAQGRGLESRSGQDVKFPFECCRRKAFE